MFRMPLISRRLTVYRPFCNHTAAWFWPTLDWAHSWATLPASSTNTVPVACWNAYPGVPVVLPGVAHAHSSPVTFCAPDVVNGSGENAVPCCWYTDSSPSEV